MAELFASLSARLALPWLRLGFAAQCETLLTTASYLAFENEFFFWVSADGQPNMMCVSFVSEHNCMLFHTYAQTCSSEAQEVGHAGLTQTLSNSVIEVGIKTRAG